MIEKILLIGQIPPPYHGSNVMAQNMLNAVSKNGYSIDFINKNFSKTINEIGKITLSKVIRVPQLISEVFSNCRISRPKLCIIFTSCGKLPFLVDFFITLVLRFFKIPYVLRFGGKGFKNLKNGGLFWKFIVISVLSNAHGGIVKGEKLKKDVNFAIPNNRLIYVQNAIEYLPYLNPNKSNENIKVLFLSNLIPTKGPLEVLKAAKIVLKDYQNVSFIIAGSDSSKSFSIKLKNYIQNNNLNNYVRMPGGIYGNKKIQLLASSDIFVFPTYYEYETFGMVNIEAMRAGLPVITSSEGAIPDIVKDGVTGYIIDPKEPSQIAEKIIVLVENPELRKKLGKKGREEFELNYTLEAYEEKIYYTISFFISKLN